MAQNNYTLTTERLGLRNWQESDIEPFIAMCQDPEVMRYFPSIASEEETRALILRLQLHFETHSFTYFAVETLDTKEFLGFTGLAKQSWESEFTPCVDMGWRFKKEAWGKGYATEAAKGCLHAAFNTFNLKEVYAFATKGNTPSENVMKKLGMQYQGTFVHPKIIDDPRFPYCFAYKKEKA